MTATLEATLADLRHANAELQKKLREFRAERDQAQAQQTASAEVLRIIASSPKDLQPVFESILANATALCDAKFGNLWLREGSAFRIAATHGAPPEYEDYLRREPVVHPDPRTGLGQILKTKKTVHVADMTSAETFKDPVRLATIELAHARTLVGVPMLSDNEVVGVLGIYRQEVRPFSDKQIDLVTSFASQAAIAIENARLLRELRQRTGDLQESLEYQIATSDVLKVISRTDLALQPVLETLVETATRLCKADHGYVFRHLEGRHHLAAAFGVTPEYREFVSQNPFVPDRGTLSGRTALERRIVHIEDVANDPEYTWSEAQKRGNLHTGLGVPLLRDNILFGLLVLYRSRVERFSDKQIQLVSTFADQAVIAIENARLIAEQREALEQQTATAEVLQVINSSPGDLVPVFDAILEKAHRLCDAPCGSLQIYDREHIRAVAVRGLPEPFAAILRQGYRPGADSIIVRTTGHDSVVQVADMAEVLAQSKTDDPVLRASVELGGVRTVLFIPLRKDDVLLGRIVAARQEVRPFSDKQIALLQNFAAQAVIAIDNARLLGELRQRTSDLQESLEYQTATSEVLKVISGSAFELTPVLESVVSTAVRLCRADQATIYRLEDGEYHWAAGNSLLPEYERIEREVRIRPGTGTLVGRVALTRGTVQILDAWTDPLYEAKEDARVGGCHTMLGVPLLREGLPIGVIGLARQRVEAYTDKEIELVSTFADQAVIAIENARLLGELRQRQTELRVTFDNMGDGVAMFDAALRLAAWNRNFQEILDLPDAFLAEPRTYRDYIRFLAERGEFGPVDPEEEIRRYTGNTARHTAVERVRPDGRVIEVRHNPVPGGGFVLIYSDITERKRSEEEIRTARDTAEMALRELKAAQANLIQAEKMASLGQLTAGIAHEIKNPLNFVNNFASLSVELLDDVKKATAPALEELDESKRAEADDVMRMLAGNLEKIIAHGRRADGIVKSMLAHSRGGSGERRSADINGLIEESLNLAYHGARALDQNFNITLERDLDPSIGAIELVPQDMTRVFLNLCGNGFYAAGERRRSAGQSDFRPILKVTTRELGDAVEVRIRDNGIGIPPEIKDRLFQPFFTTKPTGEGTGLGLSISYDIVTQQHGGTIDVESRVGDFTEFTIRLPRNRVSANLGAP